MVFIRKNQGVFDKRNYYQRLYITTFYFFGNLRFDQNRPQNIPYFCNSHSLADKKLKGTDIYMRFERLSTIGQIPTEEEWDLLQRQISTYYPGFHDFMQEHVFLLSDKERKICLLLRIGFKPTNIANMIGVTSSYITELRTKMLQKLFGLSGNSKSFDKMLREIY